MTQVFCKECPFRSVCEERVVLFAHSGGGESMPDFVDSEKCPVAQMMLCEVERVR